MRRISKRAWWWIGVAALFATCVVLKLNGSSVGVWQEVLREPGRPNGLLLFAPRHIRADEWYVVTPAMLSQARRSPAFPIENDSLGGGLSPLLMSVPVAYYTTFFRPQLWGFFLFDFEHGFAFYWCCKVFGLLIAFAWFLRQLGIKRTGIVLFGTAWLFFSSFIQWWFSSPAMLPEMIASWAVCTGCALRFFSGARRLNELMGVVAFVFFGINFVLCLYPGFQVPLIYVSLAALLGCAFQRHGTDAWQTRRGLLLLVGSAIAIVIILTPFWFTIRETLRMVSSTVYPGVYRSTGGAMSLAQLFSGIFGFFESEARVPAGFENICEASNFYPLWILVVIAAGTGAMRRLPARPLLFALMAVAALLSLYCVVPLPSPVSRVTLLGLTTEGRLFIAIGLANILLCCLFFDGGAATRGHHAFLAASAAVACGAAGSYLAIRNAAGLWGWGIVFINAGIVGFFLWRPARTAFLIGFAALVAVNGVRINPVMRGLAPLTQSSAFRTIAQLHTANPAARWIAYENVYFAQLIKATGASVLNGTKLLPDLAFMRGLDPAGHFATIYNRYAYINVALPDSHQEVSFSLVDFNYYDLKISPDAQPLRDGGYDFLVFARPWLSADLHGFVLASEIELPHLYVYKRTAE